jgi:hypothetical protein
MAIVRQTMDLAKIKSVFLKIMIGCLVAAAGLAVVTVLAGSFNDVLGKALFTIVLVAIHSLISFEFITNNEKQSTFENLSFFTNATFGIIILSFITSVLGTWSILPGDLVWKLYQLYFVLLFAILHGEVLAKTVGKQSSIDTVVYVNFVFMTIVVFMLLPLIFSNYDSSLGEFYYRVLAAAGIVDATLTLVAVILHKLYIQKHPKINDPVFAVPQNPGLPGQVPAAAGQPPVAAAPAPPPKKHMNIFVVLLIIFLGFQLLSSLVVVVLGRIAANGR